MVRQRQWNSNNCQDRVAHLLLSRSLELASSHACYCCAARRGCCCVPTALDAVNAGVSSCASRLAAAGWGALAVEETICVSVFVSQLAIPLPFMAASRL